MFASHNPLDALVRHYHDDLSTLVERTLEALDEGVDNAVLMLRKLVIEAVRHDVYEEHFLLPALHASVHDGDELVRAERASALERRRALEALTRRGVDEPGFREAFLVVARALREHATRQEPALAALHEHLGEDGLRAAGARMNPSVESGASHSMPPGIPTDAHAPWPAPDLVPLCWQVFTDEVHAREQTHSVSVS